MAKDWSKATPEELEARRAKQRASYAANAEAKKAKVLERYHSLPKEKKVAIVEQAKGNREKKRTDAMDRWIKTDCYSQFPNFNFEPNPDMYAMVKRLEKKIRARKKAKDLYWGRIQDWKKEDPLYKVNPNWAGLYPHPHAQDKIAVTELFAKFLHIKGRRCKQCGCHNMWDFSWKITLAKDVLAWQYLSAFSMKAAIENPDAYDLYCVKCSWDISLWAFNWIFSPYSIRNNPTRAPYSIGGPGYENWDKIFPAMYPAGWSAITDRIKSGALQSLSCQMLGPKGHKIDTILRKKEWNAKVKFTTHDFHHKTMQEVAALYMDNFPEMEYRMVGHNNIEEDITYVRRRKSLHMSDDLRKFLLTTPMGPHRNKDGTWRNHGTPVGARLPEVPTVELSHADGLPPEELQ